MKKYLKLLPLILYPYPYVLMMLETPVFLLLEDAPVEVQAVLFLGPILLFNLYVIFISIYNVVTTARGDMTAYEAAKMNLVVKGWQVPAYILHFVMGVGGLLMSVWGIPFILYAILIDLFTIILTGINSIGCSIKMKKECNTSLLMGIGCFIYCVDLAVAIAYVSISKKAQQQDENVVAQIEAM